MRLKTAITYEYLQGLGFELIHKEIDLENLTPGIENISYIEHSHPVRAALWTDELIEAGFLSVQVSLNSLDHEQEDGVITVHWIPMARGSTIVDRYLLKPFLESNV